MVVGVMLLAVAQSAAQSESPLSDIVITGERTHRSLRDTTSSVEVFDRQRIEATSADRIEQVLNLIPNVQMSSGGEGPTIRGEDTTGPSRDLYAFLGGTRPRTTLIVDGRAVTFNEFVYGISPLWDVDRIEVFRSPQTITQGRNSIAGAIFINTADPAFFPEYAARAIVGSARTRQFSASATGPLLPGQLAWRVAGDYRYSATSSRIADNIVGTNPNHDEYGLLRVKLLATPSAIPSSRVELVYSHSQSQMPQIEGVRAPFAKRRDPFAIYGTFRSNVDSLTADARYAGEYLSVDAIVSAGDTHFRRFAPTGLGETQIHSRDWSAESVWNWTATDRLKLTGGVSHYGSAFRQVINLSLLTGVGRFHDRQTSGGGFGEANWTVAEGATLTGGVRYQEDNQRRIGTLGGNGRPISLDFDKTFRAWLPKLSFAYEPISALRVGALVQRAYNPGGTTLRFDTAAADDFGAEFLWDYELFARAALFGDAVRLSGNFFYYDQHDAQRAEPITITAKGQQVTFANLFNVPRAHSYGAEASAEWRASSRLSLRAGIGILRTRVDDAGEVPAFNGVQFQRSPRFSASAAMEWQPAKRLLLSAQLHHNSGYFSDESNTLARRVGGWTSVDARAEWTGNHFRLFGYVRNVFDKFYLTYLFAPTSGTAGDPREFGMGIETQF